MATRIHFRYVVADSLGSVIQNAKVFVYQPGTTTDFTGTAYNAKTGGSSVPNGFISNSQGEVEAWFDTSQSIDIAITDNASAAYYPADPTTLKTFTTVTEANWDLEPAREDQASVIGVVGDITTITNAAQTAVIGVSGKWTPSDHRHAKDISSANPHGIADHTDVTRSIWLPVHDGVVLDGGTLSSLGAAPDIIRTISMADAATSGAAWAFAVPDDWVSGLTAQIYVVGATTTTGTIRWSMDAKSVAAGSSVTAAGTTTAFTGSSITTINLLVKDTATSLGITPAAVGDLVMLDIRRIGTDGGDTYAATAHMLGVRIDYTASQ